MSLKDKITKMISDDVAALFDCQGDCPEEIVAGEITRTDEYCDKCFTIRILQAILTEAKEKNWCKKIKVQTYNYAPSGELMSGWTYETTIPLDLPTLNKE